VRAFRSLFQKLFGKRTETVSPPSPAGSGFTV
jgi:hypothetical protein